MDFAPTDVIQGLFLRYLRQRHHHVSYERVVSGSGLVTIFEFMRDTGMATPSTALLDAMRVGDAAAAISQYATQGNEEIARMAMNLFLSVYGAFVGNMALAALPRGGIYLAGGIAAKISDKLKDSEFLRAYLSKGRYTGLLATMPMHIVLNQEVGLLGASLLTKRCLL